MNWLHLITGVLFLIAAIYKLSRKQAEHFFTRFLCVLWYAGTYTIPQAQIDADYIVLLIPLIEITSPIFRRYWQGKR